MTRISKWIDGRFVRVVVYILRVTLKIAKGLSDFSAGKQESVAFVVREHKVVQIKGIADPRPLGTHLEISRALCTSNRNTGIHVSSKAVRGIGLVIVPRIPR